MASTGGIGMSGSSEGKEIVRRVFDAFYTVDADTLRELLSPDFVGHSMPPGFAEDQEGWLEMAREWGRGFSDDDTTVDDLLAAEEGRVVVRFTTRATHSGDAFGFQASNRRVTMTGIEIYAVGDGKVTDWWGVLDLTELLAAPESVTPGTGESLG
jgi:predicted ester cyclase